MSRLLKIILNKLRELIILQDRVLLAALINLKLKGHITINDKIATEDDLEKIIYENFLEKKKEIYRKKIKDIFVRAIDE